MKYFKSVDIIRALSLILMLIYHFWVLTGSIAIKNESLYIIVKLGGEFGVTSFFLLSGFGIFNSLNHQNNHNDSKFLPYIKRRLKRIYPEYFLSILIVVLFMNGAYYLSRENIWHVFSHLLLIHNFFVGSHGSINGALWTMGVIFQFYLIAMLLHKYLNRFGIYFVFFSIILTVVSRYIIFNYCMDYFNFGVNYFIAGRQLLTSLDNFVIGMYVAYSMKYEFKNKNSIQVIFIVIILSLLLISAGKTGLYFGINTNNISGYIWHSIIAILLGLITYFSTKIEEKANVINKALLYISKYEYGIYLLHLVLISNLLEKSLFLINLVNNQKILEVFTVLFILSISSGVVFTRLVNGIRNDYQKK